MCQKCVQKTKYELEDLEPYQFEQEMKKGWGRELWITNNHLYCGKILEFEQGKRCSYHKHEQKMEHFHLLEGEMLIRYGYESYIDKAQEAHLRQGDSFFVPIGLYHQMIALKPSKLLEFSTTHYEEDSYRSVRGD